jgi:hypothetical protein
MYSSVEYVEVTNAVAVAQAGLAQQKNGSSRNRAVSKNSKNSCAIGFDSFSTQALSKAIY